MRSSVPSRSACSRTDQSAKTIFVGLAWQPFDVPTDREAGSSNPAADVVAGKRKAAVSIDTAAPGTTLGKKRQKFSLTPADI